VNSLSCPGWLWTQDLPAWACWDNRHETPHPVLLFLFTFDLPSSWKGNCFFTPPSLCPFFFLCQEIKTTSFLYFLHLQSLEFLSTLQIPAQGDLNFTWLTLVKARRSLVPHTLFTSHLSFYNCK
jgi:hypothetical protein